MGFLDYYSTGLNDISHLVGGVRRELIGFSIVGLSRVCNDP